MKKTLIALTLAVVAVSGILINSSAVAKEIPAKPQAKKSYTYAVVIQKALSETPGWKKVVDALVKKHGAKVITFDKKLYEIKKPLKEFFPDYVCFLATPRQCSRPYTAAIHQMMRTLDDDPYTDVRWGIITGTPENALEVASYSKPLVIKNSLNTTGVTRHFFDKCVTISDSGKGAWGVHENGKPTIGGTEKARTVDIFRKYFNTMKFDLMVTSAHGIRHGLEMPWGLGMIISGGDKIMAFPTVRKALAARAKMLRGGTLEGGEELKGSENAKVYMPIGNCLIGDTMRSDKSMVPTFMSKKFGFKQLVGYSLPSWFGRGGWGTLHTLLQHASYMSIADAWFFNNQMITYKLNEMSPKALKVRTPFQYTYTRKDGTREMMNTRMVINNVAMQLIKLGIWPKTDKNAQKEMLGLCYDRDTVIFYGDPAWRATLNPEKANDKIKLNFKEENGKFVVEIKTGEMKKALKKAKDDYPNAMFFPFRIKNFKVVEGSEFNPIVTDNFIMIRSLNVEGNKTYRIVLEAEKA